VSNVKLVHRRSTYIDMHMTSLANSRVGVPNARTTGYPPSYVVNHCTSHTFPVKSSMMVEQNNNINMQRSTSQSQTRRGAIQPSRFGSSANSQHDSINEEDFAVVATSNPFGQEEDQEEVQEQVLVEPRQRRQRRPKNNCSATTAIMCVFLGVCAGLVVPSVSAQPLRALTPSLVNNFSGNLEMFGSRYWFQASIDSSDEGTIIGSVELSSFLIACLPLELVTFVSDNEIVFKIADAFDVTATLSAGSVTLSSNGNTQGPGAVTAIDPFPCSSSESLI